MTTYDDERQAARVAPSANADLLDPDATLEDRQFAGALARSLGRLREPRVGFQQRLERQLLAQLAEAEPAAPAWWRRLVPASRPAHRQTGGLARLPRRSLLGLAAGAAVTLLAASLLGPFGGAPEASASDIIELSQARAENPVLAGVKSFHLTATSWGADRPASANDITTEQWFVAPDKMRTETRSKDGNGKTVISGMLALDGKLKAYESDGASGKGAIGIFMAPIGQKPGGGPSTLAAPGPAGGPPPPADGTPVTRTQQTSVSTAMPPGADAQAGDVIYVATRKPEGEAGANSSDGPEDGKPQTFTIGPGCPEPKRTGEDVIAGRPAFKVEHDMSSCLPADAPGKVPARTVSWVDKTTYLPLKLEGYDKSGNLMDRYQVQSIEYDVTIPDSIFSNLPAGVTVHDNPFQFAPPPPDGKDGPSVRVIATPTSH